MPLPQKTIDSVNKYCEAHLAQPAWYENEFDFIDDGALRQRIILEFKSARYIYKLGEALFLQNERHHPILKFQITQYASIYEAIIVYLLFGIFRDRQEVIDIQYHQAYKISGSFPRDVDIRNADGEELFLCASRKEKTSSFSIKFDDKVDASVKIGFITAELGAEIKEFYRLRNAIHIETAARRAIDYELEQALNAYRRMRPFIDGIKSFLSSIPTTQTAVQE